MPVEAVLWDADGVLQRGPGGRDDFLGGVLGERGEEIGTEIFTPMADALSGRLRMREHVAEILTRHGLVDRIVPVLDVWKVLQPVPGVRALVESLPVPSYLVTNQDDWRAECMRAVLDYDEFLAGSYYSCDLGLAKPDPAYFTAIATDLDLRADQLLFIDDREENVLGAREAGLAADVWDHTAGLERLRALLGRHLEVYPKTY